MSDNQSSTDSASVMPQGGFVSNPVTQEDIHSQHPSYSDSSGAVETEGLVSQTSQFSGQQQQTGQLPQVEQPPIESPQIEGGVEKTSLSIDYVSQQRGSSENSGVPSKEKGQKMVFALALFLFITSLFGLGFYLINAWKEGRLGRVKSPVSSPAPTQVAEITPVPSSLPEDSTADWLIQEGDSFVLKYPADLEAFEEGNFITFFLSPDKNKTVFKLKVLPRLESKDILTVLAEEARKIDSKVTLEDVKKAVSSSKIGSYTLFSYGSGTTNDLVFHIFEDTIVDKTVFILDYSNGDNRFENLISNVVSSFKFTDSTNTPSASPSAKFNVGE